MNVPWVLTYFIIPLLCEFHNDNWKQFVSLFQVFDYTQYYMDLSRVNANSNQNAEWLVEYNFSTYYPVNEINAINLHILADRLTQNYPQEIFDRFV